MQGLIFIPDISGFTNFVKRIPIDLGVSITRDLLNEIIDNSPIDIHLSEIEGDAVLFYKLGKPIGLKTLLAAFSTMTKAFKSKYAVYKTRHNLKTDLSLKLIVHYGNISVYNIRGFKKVYGEPVIESHRLLKNGSTSSDYVLITDDYMKAVKHSAPDAFWHDFPDDFCSSHGSHFYSDSKKLNYSFFTASKNQSYNSTANSMAQETDVSL